MLLNLSRPAGHKEDATPSPAAQGMAVDNYNYSIVDQLDSDPAWLLLRWFQKPQNKVMQ